MSTTAPRSSRPEREKFSRLKADLAAAQRFIHVQYFIWEDDELTDALTEILRERAPGRRARCDSSTTTWAASTGTSTKLEALVPLGVKVAKDVVSLSHLNYRDHRKIVVIDGEIGYTGGYNVGQEYVDGGKRFARWRDTHLRVTGQVVGELPGPVRDALVRRTNEDVRPTSTCRRRRQVPPRNRHPVPGRGAGRRGPLAVFAARPHAGCRQCRAACWIQSPYFVPDVGLYDTMIDAALSGVDVRFMMTGVPDKKVPYWAAWTYFRRLLEAGVRVYLYEAGFLHSKTIVVDSQVAAIGTMNMDIRSLRLHKELMLWLFYEGLRGQQNSPSRRTSRDPTRSPWRTSTRSLCPVRFRNSFMRLLSYFI